MKNEPENQLFGAYNGVPIRSKRYKSKLLISATDLKKACEATSKFRFDRLRNSDRLQEMLATKAKKLKVEPIRNKSGLILEVSGAIEVISGGDRSWQGTYVNEEMALLYVSWMGEESQKEVAINCCNWLQVMFSEDKETEVIKAQKVIIYLGNIELEVYEIPSGEYLLSQTQVSEMIGKKENNFREFLQSKSPEALPYKDYKTVKIREKGAVGRPPNGIPIKIAGAFWLKESIKGNKIASRLLAACLVESIERRADKAFGKKVTEQEYNQRWQHNYKAIVADCPTSFITQQKTSLNISVHQGDTRRLKKLYPKGVIPGFTKKDRIIERVVFLSAHAKDDAWKLKPRQELQQLGKTKKSKYPDLMSGVIEVNNLKAVFIFQVYEDIVRSRDVEICVGRRYTQIAKRLFDIDHSFLFLVAPLGASNCANEIIQDEVDTGENQAYNFIGIMTIKELANFYHQQATSGKGHPRNIGAINKDFRPFMDYRIYSPIDRVIQLTLPLASAS